MTGDTECMSAGRDYWTKFYARGNHVATPSPFALWCMDTWLNSDSLVLELGCGNGRDSFAFAERGMKVLGVDQCAAVVRQVNARASAMAAEREAVPRPRFLALDVNQIARLPELAPDFFSPNTSCVLYSRFFLHAVPERLEDVILRFSAEAMSRGSLMLHEFRTIRDPLMDKGIKLSRRERVTDHYRRFLDPEVLRAKLPSLGWREACFSEGRGLAPLGGEDPVVARIAAWRT